MDFLLGLNIGQKTTKLAAQIALNCSAISGKNDWGFSLLGMMLHSAGILGFHCIKSFIRGFFLDSIAAQIPNPFGLLSPLWIQNDELALSGIFHFSNNTGP
jgi:hypothetical protein